MDLVRIAEIFGTPEQARAAAEGMSPGLQGPLDESRMLKKHFRWYRVWWAALLWTFIIWKYDERTSKNFIRR